jgi:hypothetical protein
VNNTLLQWYSKPIVINCSSGGWYPKSGLLFRSIEKFEHFFCFYSNFTICMFRVWVTCTSTLCSIQKHLGTTRPCPNQRRRFLRKSISSFYESSTGSDIQVCAPMNKKNWKCFFLKKFIHFCSCEESWINDINFSQNQHQPWAHFLYTRYLQLSLEINYRQTDSRNIRIFFTCFSHVTEKNDDKISARKWSPGKLEVPEAFTLDKCSTNGTFQFEFHKKCFAGYWY